MGIPKFLSYLKTKYPTKWIIEQNTMGVSDKWDYLILDYQSLGYSTYELFFSEVNYFIRIIHHPNPSLTMIQKILTKYSFYFTKVYGYIPLKPLEELDMMLNTNYNDVNIIIETLIQLMIIHTKNLATHHIASKQKYSHTYIFFDGIPSIAKIKEQVMRRVFPEFLNPIKKELLDSIPDCLEKRIRIKLLPELPPSIGLGTPVVNGLRDELKNITDPVLGTFNINENQLGEAEHQITRFINKYSISN